MQKISILLFFFCNLFSQISNAQYNGNIWVLGDSAGINFNTNPPSTFKSGMLGRNGCATICNGSNGDLLFYCYGYDYYLESLAYRRSGIIKDKNNFTMVNGDSLIAEWYHDMIIIPKSFIDSTFYVFTAGITRDAGLWYNIVDLKQNNGLGAVVQKNIQLQSFNVFDGLTAVKYADGKDWWLVCQRWDAVLSFPNNYFYVYRIDSSGVNSIPVQNVGALHADNSSGDVSFNADGSKMIFVDWGGMIQIFDFNRLTGIISNPLTIEAELSLPPYPYYASAVFSPNGRFLYVSSYNEVNNHAKNYLYQYDLTATNISSDRIVLDSFPYHTGINMMEIARDHKIYLAASDEIQGYPYPDTSHTMVTDNLSVINSPDSLGLACDFQPFSFYLGGNCSYYGLPNNPDYTLGPLDTLTAVHEIKNNTQQPNTLKIFYHPTWDIAFINADKLSGRKYTLSLFDITGKLIFKEEGNLTSQYFTKDLSMQSFAKGVYIGVLQTEKEKISKRFVKY